MSLRTFINSVRLLLDQGVYTARNAIRAEDESSSHHLDVTQLEERVLMSASPLAVVAEPPEAAAATAATTELAAITTVPANDGLQLDDQQLLDVVGDAVLPQPSVDGDDSRLLPDASEHTLELVFVDGSVNDLDQMVENLQSANTSDENSTLEIIILESQTDGMGQISSTMRNYRDIDAIHVVSHGSDGQVRLGSTTLSLDNLDDYRSSIGAWQDSMSSEADLLFYGCNLAATADGQELMNQISAEWDVDVAASDDLTGHSDFGGDWDLEYQTGDVETQIAFSTDLQENWYNVLAIAVDNSSDGGMSSGSTTTVSHTTSGDNRLMLVGVATDPHGESVASITYNGFNLSLVGAEEDSGSHSRAEIWSLVAPDTGSHDVVVTMTGNGHHGVVVGVMTFTGVDQTTPLENFSAASGASNTASTTVTSTSDDLVFGVVHSHHGSSSAAGAGQTEYWDRTEWVSNGSGTVEAGAASVTTSWTVTNDDWTVAAVSIRSASAPPVITNIETVDQDADGQIDQIRITTSETLNDNFGDLSIAVWGYEINTGVGTNGYTTGATANDNIFYVNLVESGTPDTGATPNVSVVQNTLLTEDGGTDALAADAGHIVFERNSNIYTADPDGSNETLVLDDPGGLNNFAPVFSPDRSKIFFYSDRDGTNNQWDIWSMDADGSNLTQLTTGSDNDRFATLSPDGTKILWERQVGGDRQIWIMDSDGSNQQVLINSGSNDRQPAWSPDGSQIVFRSDRDGNDNIYVADADGSNQTPLTSSTDNERGPRWSPDGTQILYTRDVGGDNQVWIMDADGGNQTMIVDSLGEDENPSWSPDGSRIIFISTRDGNNEIYTADPDGMNQARETNNGVDENRPRWASAWTVAATDDADPVATITRDDADPTSADTVNFSVDFSEDVSNVTADDFTVVTTGTVTANMTVTVTQVTASTYTVTIDTIAGDGTVSLDFNGATDIVDGVGNAINTIPSTDEVYTIDQPPVITARETVDSDGDGQIDQIRITTSEALNDNFGDLVIRVNGIEYSAADMDTGATALDNVFNVNLTPSGTPDTDATPYVAIVANTMLADGGAAPDALSPDGGPGWWDVYWQNRQQITLDWSAHPGADRIDFPVRIQLDSGDVDFSKIKAGGADIRFRDADGSELSYEIETWDDVGETATIWVKVPVLDTSSSQIIHLYYNNPTAIDDQDLDGTWAANFAGVYHLDESGTAANGFQDSSGNGVHGQGGDGNPIFVPIEVSPGHSGDHQLFDGANDHVNFASRDFGNQFTIEAWIKPDNTPNAIQGIVANSATGFSTQGFRFFIRGDDGTIRLETRGPSSGSAVVQTAASQVNFGVWNHVAVTVDRTAGTATIYHNGVNVATGAVKTDFPTNSDWEIGGFEDRVISFDGEIDEVRVSSTARDASHILASYMSQLDDSLNTFGVEEEVGVVATDAAAPVLISATTPQSDGSNLFQAEGQTLDLVFSEALGASISEVNLEIALLFGGGASDGDNLPTLGTGANPIAFTTTNVANDTLRVTFNTNNVANADWLRVGTHTVQIADGSNLDDAVGNDGNTAGAAVTITGVANTAPVLDNTGDMTLTDVAEDDTNPPGNTVQAIIDSAAGDRVTDVDFFSVEGIAVTDVDDTDGTWQYNTGSGWTIFGSVTDNAAVLLNDAALIRFVPNGNYNGSAGDITFRAWDRTSGVNGQIGVDVSANGGSTAFSIATETATLDVSSINDEPTISAIADQSLSEDTATGAIAFTISDVETAAGALTLTATSSDQALVPDGNITLGGSGSNRTIEVLPGLNQTGGPATITVSVNDGTTTTQTTFDVTVTAVNDAPVISSIADQSLSEDTATGAIAFTISDVETAAGALTLTATSSDQALVPDGNITLGGSGSNRTIDVLPGLNQSGGPATITVSVNDGTTTTQTTFDVTVTAVNDAPVISSIADQSLSEDTSTGAIAFTISDVETAAGALTLTATSSDQALVPDGNITLGGSGSNRTIEVLPGLNQSGGPATITVSVNDGTTTTQTTFDVTVTAVNDAPVISSIADQSPSEDTSTGAIAFTISDVETAAGALTLTATSSDQALVPDGNITLGGSGSNRTIEVLPGLNQSGGPATITVSVNDGTTTTQTTFDVTVTAVNDAPVISSIADQSPSEDTSTGAIAFTISDVETAAGALTLTATSSDQALVPDGNITLGGSGSNRTIEVLPGLNQTGGPATITVSVNDGTTTTQTTFDVTVTAVNDAPVISSIADQSLSEDTATGAIAFTISDVETAAGALTLTATSSDQALVPDGNITLGGSGSNRTIEVLPGLNQSGGPATITVSVNDGTTTTQTTFDVTVTAVNDAPVISSIADQSPSEDTSTGAIAFTISDVETAAGALTLTATSSDQALVPDGNITLGGSGSNRTIEVLPGLNQTGGPATITVSVNDGTTTTQTTFDVTVTAVNDAPVISSIADQSLSEDTATGAIAFTISDVETAAGALTLTATSSDQALVPDGNITLGGSGSNRTIEVLPGLNQTGGPATITVSVNDGTTTTQTTFDVTVTAVNDAPVISSIADQSLSEDTATGAIAFTISDVETAAGALTLTATSSDQALVPDGNITLGGSGSNRTIDVLPGLNQSGGPATITVSVNDGTTTTQTTFDVTVTAVNDAPVISSIADQSLSEDTSTGAIAFTISDVETAAGALTLTATSSDQALVPDGNITLGGSGSNRTIEVLPGLNQSGGPATITVSVNDGTTTTQTTFDVTVTAVNDAPVISSIADQSPSEDTSTGAIAFTISDVETAAGALTLTATSSDQALVPDGNITLGGSGSNRTIEVLPGLNQTGGPATITVSVNDGTTTTQTTFDVTVTAVNDAPVISSIADQSLSEDTATGAIAFTISDVETAAGALTLTATSSDQALVPDGNITLGGSGSNRTIEVLPGLNQTGGPATITVSVNDGTTTTQTTFDVTVTAVNDAPVISSIADQSLSEDTATGAIAFTISDVETAAGALTLTATSSDQALVPDGNITLGGSGSNRTIEVLPGLNQSGGPATITVSVNDGTTTTQTTFDVTVTAVNDAPVISSIADQSPSEDTSTGAIAFTISDVETAAGALTLTATSSDQALVPDGNITLGGSGSNRTIEVLPGLNQTGGPATITVSVNDGTTTTQTTFDVTVTAVNDAPIDVTLSGSVVDENSADGTIIGNVSGTDPDVGDVLMFSLINSAGGRFAVDVNTGEFTVADGNQLDFEAASSHGVTVRVTDSGGLSRDESYTITVSDLNEAPTAVNDTFSARQMEELVVPAGVITGNDFDSDGDSVTVVLVAGPGDGTLALAADGSFTYASVGLFSGQDQFTYYVTDGTLNSDVATVDIDVLMTIVVPDVVRVTDSDTSSEIQEDAVDEKPTDDNEATVELPSDAANATATSVSAAKNITTGEQDSGRPTVPEMSIEVLQSTGSDLSIFVFLSDVPESGFQHNDNRALQNDSSGLIDRTSVDAGRFLFRQIYTDSAFFPSGQMASAMTEYWQHQDDQAVQEQVVENMVVGSTAMVSTSVSVGYAVWLLRGGSLLTTFLSSLPVWQAFDPLHVLNSFEEYGDEEQNSESLESLVS